MKTNTSPAPRNSNDPNHPPLARDSQGNLISIPDGTAAWCLKRETGGRPRTILGPDRQPARFQLDITRDDLETMLGAGTYRVYALDSVGETLDYVTTIVIGTEQGEREDEVAVNSNARSLGSDLRHALDTIREMARAQADSLKSVAMSQADWVKGLAAAKQMPRNGIQFLPPPPPRMYEEDDGEQEGDDEEDEPQPGSELPQWAAAIQESVKQVTQAVSAVAAVKQMQAAAAAPALRNATPSAPQRNAMAHLAQINARLTRKERTYVNLILRGKAADELTNELVALDLDAAVAFVKEAVAFAESQRDDGTNDEARVPDAPPRVEAPVAKDFMSHVMAVSAHLTAEESSTVMALLPRLAPDRTQELTKQLLAMSPQDAAAWVRENLKTLVTEVSS